jgi:hypothetical protein
MQTVYIDQNILGYIAEGVIGFPYDQMQCIISETHFKEIPIDNSDYFIDALTKVKAKLVRPVLDKKFDFTNEGIIIKDQTIKELYEIYKERAHLNHFENIFDNFLATLAGGSYFDETIKLPDKLMEYFSNLDMEEELKNPLINAMDPIMVALKEIIETNMKNVDHIEGTRKRIGTDKGRLNQISSGDIFKGIWEHIKSNSGIDFQSIIEKQLSGKPKYLQVAALNAYLNHLGYNPDIGLSKPEHIPNVRYDGEHMSNAVFCDALLTEDRRMAHKACAIYQYLDIQTKVFRFKINGKKQD